MNVLVLPTNRPESALAFLDAWRPWPWDALVIVEDAPEPLLPAQDGRVVQCCWRDIDGTLADPGIISRRDSGIRAYGFWRAWAMGADYIFTLDDDCFPTGSDYVGQHLANFEATPMWCTSLRGLRVRGLPYENVGVTASVQVSMGLWIGHPDIDAVQSLANPGQRLDTVLDRGRSSWLMPSAQYFPLCGMNLAFSRAAACLMYFPPMGEGSPYGRFDDIWAGLVVQRICRHLHWSIACGHPVVDHQRASDPFANLVKEAPGIRANERMWEIVDAIELRGQDALTCMGEVGEALSRFRTDDYVARWGRGILEWCKLFASAETPVALTGAATSGHA